MLCVFPVFPEGGEGVWIYFPLAFGIVNLVIDGTYVHASEWYWTSSHQAVGIYIKAASMSLATASFAAQT
jgi:hypothetical protein